MFFILIDVAPQLIHWMLIFFPFIYIGFFLFFFPKETLNLQREGGRVESQVFHGTPLTSLVVKLRFRDLSFLYLAKDFALEDNWPI